MKKKIKFLVITSWTIISIISCGNNETILIEHLKSLEQSIDSEKLISILKTHHEDSISNLLPLLSPQLNKLNKNKSLWPIEKQNELANYLKSYELNLQDEIIIIAFIKYLNNRKLDIDKINQTVIHNSNEFRKKVEIESKLFEQTKSKNIKFNFNNFNVQDTLNLILQLQIENEEKHVFYTNSQNFIIADDTFKVKGILIEKTFNGKNEISSKLTDSEYQDINFKIRTIEISHDNVLMDSAIITIESIINLNLARYHKQIIKN